MKPLFYLVLHPIGSGAAYGRFMKTQIPTIVTISRCAMLASVLTLIAGCSAARSPVTPTTAGPGASAPAPAPAPQCSGNTLFSPVTAPARVYLAATSCPAPSRYVLYDDGTFEMAYSGQSNPFLGTYTETSGTITFTWQAWSLAGPWGATGAISDETLAVTYNLVMQLTDFEDAVYARVR